MAIDNRVLTEMLKEANKSMQGSGFSLPPKSKLDKDEIRTDAVLLLVKHLPGDVPVSQVELFADKLAELIANPHKFIDLID